jgi:hypothetical protein
LEAHDFVHGLEHGEADGFRVVFEDRAGGGFLLSGGFGGGDFVAVLLKAQGFFADAREGHEEAEVGFSFVFGAEVGERDLGEVFAEANGGEFEAEVLELGGAFAFGEVEGEVESGVHAVEFFLVLEPVLEAAVVPVGEVVFGDGVWEWRIFGPLELRDDFGIRGAVVEELVDAVAEFAGKAGDFAAATARA